MILCSPAFSLFFRCFLNAVIVRWCSLTETHSTSNFLVYKKKWNPTIIVRASNCERIVLKKVFQKVFQKPMKFIGRTSKPPHWPNLLIRITVNTSTAPNRSNLLFQRWTQHSTAATWLHRIIRMTPTYHIMKESKRTPCRWCSFWYLWSASPVTSPP